LRPLVCLAALSLSSPPAVSGGYYYSDSGIVATGRGGAFIAGADNQFAQYYNPAGLIRVEHPELNLGVSFVQQHIAFTRTRIGDDGQLETFPVAENQASPFVVPHIGFVTPISRQLAFAFGFWSPFAPSSEYDAGGPQRYTIIDTQIWQFGVGPSLAWRPVPQFTLGMTLAWQVLKLEEQIKVTITGDDNPGGDVLVDARVVDLFTPGFTAGFLIDPHPMVSIGGSVWFPSQYEGGGTGALDFAGNDFAPFLDPTAYEDEVKIQIALPWVVRAGVAIRPVPRLEIETAFVWQGWSSLSSISVQDIDVTVTGPLVGELAVDPQLELPAGLQDTYSFRLGAEVEVIDELELRAGGFWESGSVPERSTNVALIDPWKAQVGMGSTLKLVGGRLKIDTSVAGLFFPAIQVEDSDVTQINVLSDVDDPLLSALFPGGEAVVGNGTYSASGWVVGVAARWAFVPWRSGRK